MTGTPRADAFVAARGHATDVDPVTLEARIAALSARAAAMDGADGLDEVLFARVAGTSENAGAAIAGASPVELGDDSVAELALATGVASHNARALEAFEARYVRRVAVMLAKMKLDDAVLDEVRQHVRTTLLIAPTGELPKLARYAGAGRLEGLIRVTATRAALDRVRAAAVEIPTEREWIDVDALSRDPALAGLAERFRTQFREAFARAADALEPRERNILKLHLLGGVTLDRLATMYGVHRATVVRWLADARAKMLRMTRKELQSDLGVRPDELDSLMHLVESQLDASVERLFRTRDPSPDER